MGRKRRLSTAVLVCVLSALLGTAVVCGIPQTSTATAQLALSTKFHFGEPKNIDAPSHDLHVVSCPNVSFCVALDYTNRVFMYHGSSWPGHKLSDGFSVTSLSCASENFCVAMDEDVNYLEWSGKSWSAPAPDSLAYSGDSVHPVRSFRTELEAA